MLCRKKIGPKAFIRERVSIEEPVKLETTVGPMESQFPSL